MATTERSSALMKVKASNNGPPMCNTFNGSKNNSASIIMDEMNASKVTFYRDIRKDLWNHKSLVNVDRERILKRKSWNTGLPPMFGSKVFFAIEGDPS